MPVFVLSSLNDQDLLKIVQNTLDEEVVAKVKQAASKRPVSDADLLQALVSYARDSPRVKQFSRKRPHIRTVIMAQNRAGRDIPKISNVHHGKSPVLEDGVHLNTEGQITLREMTAAAINHLYESQRSQQR